MSTTEPSLLMFSSRNLGGDQRAEKSPQRGKGAHAAAVLDSLKVRHRRRRSAAPDDVALADDVCDLHRRGGVVVVEDGDAVADAEDCWRRPGQERGRGGPGSAAARPAGAGARREGPPATTARAAPGLPDGLQEALDDDGVEARVAVAAVEKLPVAACGGGGALVPVVVAAAELSAEDASPPLSCRRHLL